MYSMEWSLGGESNFEVAKVEFMECSCDVCVCGQVLFNLVKVMDQ